MNIQDFINGLFELGGGLFIWLSFFKLLRDKQVKGVSLFVMGFFCLFAAWNLYYYPHLNQNISFIGALFLMAGNWSWMILALYYKYSKKT